MARTDDETPWTTQLLTAVGALLAVALVIGGVVSVMALGAAKVAGVGGSDSGRTAQPSLYLPTGEPSTSPSSSSVAEPAPSAAPSQSRSAKPKPKPVITLQASPATVASNQRIDLTGVYERGGEGARLQVQRFENGWVDFPVSVDVKGGVFTTYIYTGRSGVNRFRVVDTESDRTSNPVRVTVR